MTVYYKWLLPNYVSAVQKKVWPVAVGEWTPKESPILCRSGWHGVEEKHVLNHLPLRIGAELWEVEAKGEVIHSDDKFAAEQMRLLWKVGVTTNANLRLFACDVAEDVLPYFEKVLPNDRRPHEAIAVARRFANGHATAQERAAAGDAAWDAARAAAGDAAWDAAGAAAWSAARAAAWDAARAAARDAARDAAWDAAGAAAGAAAWDAAGAAAWSAAGDAAWAAAWAAARDAAWSAAWDAARAAAGDAAWDAAWDAARAAAWAKYSNWLVVRIESGY